MSGSRNIWQTDTNCSKFDINLLYSPINGECSFFNPEFTTKMSFDENRRLNTIDDKISYGQNIISVLGDSFAMGWGVNDDETFSYYLQKLMNKKVINLGVSSYGTIREIKKLKLNQFQNQVDTVIIQYHLNDIYENINLDINKVYSKKDYNEKFLNQKDNLNFTSYIFKNYKKSLRLLFSHLNDIIFKEKNMEKYYLAEHLNILDDIINKNINDHKKDVIIFLIKEPHQILIYDKDKEFKNFKFFIIEANKEHFFIIDDHLNELGHKFVSEKLFDYLSKQ